MAIEGPPRILGYDIELFDLSFAVAHWKGCPAPFGMVVMTGIDPVKCGPNFAG